MTSKKPLPKSLPSYVLLFDDTCSFCQRCVRKILQRDKERHLVCLPLKTPQATSLLKRFPKLIGQDSLVLISLRQSTQKAWIRFAALKKIVSILHKPGMLFWLQKIPLPLGNHLYSVIARLRKNIPTSPVHLRNEFSDRFFDS
ncbi:MAG: DCC1-like thiol-disulfide oxidoreductase family protein [Chlamydiota bacterium]